MKILRTTIITAKELKEAQDYLNGYWHYIAEIAERLTESEREQIKNGATLEAHELTDGYNWEIK